MGAMRSSRVVTATAGLALAGLLGFGLPLAAQVCGSGGSGSGSGNGGATLVTIAVDGSPADWGPVLANSNQLTHDGEWADCASSTDKDFVINPVGPVCASRSISGRDLAQFAWTYDGTDIYLYVKRFGSSTNTQTFYFYMDSDSNQRMNGGEKVYQVQLSGSNRKTDGTLYSYTAVDGTNGDPLVAPAGATYPGYADGYTVVGAIASPVAIYAGVIGGFADGTGFEARIPWSAIGVPAGTAIYFHVSSTNSSNPAQVPASLDDNLGGVDGRVGAFAFRSLSVTPDNASAVTPGNPTVAWYDHTVKNTGTLADRYDLTLFSALGLTVDLYLADGTTWIATDADGDGDFTDAGDSVDPAYDSNLDNRPDTPSLTAAGAFSLKVKITAPAAVQNVQEITTLSAFSQGDPSLCASARDTTAIGALALTPTPQAKSIVAGQWGDYGLTLGNYSLEDTFDLSFLSARGWQVQLYTDPNGDGNPADGLLAATDTNGDGDYLDAGDGITSGYDTDASGRPDFGALANGVSVHFVVRLTAASGAAEGDVDTCMVLAQGADHGASASALLASTVRARLAFTPSYTVATSTNKYSGQGQSVFYAHTLINSWPEADTVVLSSTSSPAGWSVRYWTDPNGDGNPGDGTQITAPLTLAANGGTQKLVVEVVIPSGLTLPLTHTTVVTATGTASAPAVTDEVRVSYIATYSDPNRTLSWRVFALCQTVYTRGSSLVPNSTYTFRYLNPAGTVVRTQSDLSDGNGEAVDSYTFNSVDMRGNWTLELRNAANGLVDSILVYVDPPPANPSSVAPLTTGRASYGLTGDSLSLSATFNNTSTGADYTGTTYLYRVRTADLTQYLRSDGLFAAYTGSELTRSTTPHTVYASTSASETVTVTGVEFPATGIYRVDVTWVGSCGFTIASASLYFPVGTTLASFADGAHAELRDDFGTGASVYLGGTTFLPSTPYTVAYYRPDGTLAFTHAATSSADGTLSDSASVASLLSDGAWHAVVYQSGLTAPPLLNLVDASASSVDAFSVDTVPPVVTVGMLSTPETSPALSVTVDDPDALVQVIVGGVTYAATNHGDGTWTLPAGTISPALLAGVYDVIAVATDLADNDGTDATMDELAIQFAAPTVDGPLVEGGTAVTGTSTAPDGTTITVTVGGVPYTTTVTGGTWSVTVPPLAAGAQVSATAGTGAATSAASNTVTVVHAAPAVNGPVTPMTDTLTGTSSSPDGTLITVYQNGIAIGTTTVSGGTWSLTGFPALTDGATLTATAGAGPATSTASAGVLVSVALLRYGGVTVLDPQDPPNSAIFSAPVLGASLTVARDLEKAVFPSGDTFTHETSDLGPTSSPLIFYQVAGMTGDTLRVTISAGKIVITH